jgi:hypothetical protein
MTPSQTFPFSSTRQAGLWATSQITPFGSAKWPC